MALEFLHAEGDIPEFVDFLYEKGYALSHRCGPRRGLNLSRQDAVYAMQDDLHTSWGTYVISGPRGNPVLHLDSCGPQAHPSKLGRQGRFAGRIAWPGEKTPESEQMMRLIRNYFRRNYTYQRYNGDVRMSCHFGPAYQKTEAEFFACPGANRLCTGFLQIICPAEQADGEARAAAGLLDRPDVRDVRISVRRYWADHAWMQVRIPFLYDTEDFNCDGYVDLVARLCGSASAVRTQADHLFISVTNRIPVVPGDDGQAKYVALLLARPWIPLG